VRQYVGAMLLGLENAIMWFGKINQRRAQRRALLHATLVQIRPKKTQPILNSLSY